MWRFSTMVQCDLLRCQTHILNERCNTAPEKAVSSDIKHTVEVWTAFNHLKNNPFTKFYEHCDKQQVEIS